MELSDEMTVVVVLFFFPFLWVKGGEVLAEETFLLFVLLICDANGQFPFFSF